MAISLTVLLGVGCSRDDAVHLPDGHGALRLVDLVSVAEVSSPLLEVEPIDSIGEIRGAEPTRTVNGQFVRNQSTGCRTESGPDGGLEVFCKDADVEAWWKIPVAAHGHSRVSLEVRANEPECFEVVVQNGKQEEIFLTLDGQLRGEWQRVSTTVTSASSWGPGLRVRVRSYPGRAGCDTRVRAVTGEEFELGVDHELGLLKAESPLPGSDPGIGLAKFGIMMPTAMRGRVSAPFDDNFTISEGIVAPPPTEITFRIHVPDQSRLRFSYGPHRGSKTGDAVGFEVRVKRRWRDPEILWTDIARVDDTSWHWREAKVDLSRYADTTVDLVLRSFVSEGERAYGVWGTPTVDVPRIPADPPNIIVIGVDTLRADRLSCFGFPGSVSPNIDGLASDAVRFTDAIAQSNWTRPSFASIFSGLTVESHGLLSLLDEFAPSVTTMAEILRTSGWSTHAIAYKPALAGRGFEQGFESYFNIPKVEHLAQENLDKVLAFLRRDHDRRFFLFLHFNDPHLPYTHPEPFFSAESRADVDYFAMTRPVWIESDVQSCSNCGKPGEREPRYDRMGRRMYVEEVRYLDDRIGALLDELKALDLYDDSIIVFVSDHGESLWDHFDQFGHGGKNHHDELIRVPLIIKPHRGWGGAMGAVVDSQVRAFDLMPTVLELAGLDVSGLDLDAESLAPIMREPIAERRPRLAVSTNEYASAVRVRPWKYVRPLPPHAGPQQLFNLETDPEEHADVASLHPEVVRELRHTAAEHILLHHGGIVVAVISDEGDHSVRIRWNSDVELVPTAHLGLPPIAAGGDSILRFRTSEFAFSGAVGPDPLAVLAGFLVGDGAALDISVDGGPVLSLDQFPVYRAGELERVFESGEEGIFAFAAPGPSHRRLDLSAGGETRVDAQQLDALRALGYVTE